MNWKGQASAQKSRKCVIYAFAHDIAFMWDYELPVDEAMSNTILYDQRNKVRFAVDRMQDT